jgi:phosphate transport system permease protein
MNAEQLMASRARIKARVRAARAVEFGARVLTGGLTLATIAIAMFILGSLVVRGLPAISWEFLTARPTGGMRGGGIGPVIVGTLWLVGFTALFTVPIGVAAGVYLAEYATRGRGTRMIRLSIANMAGVPSIVYGLFGLAVFVLAFKIGVSVLAGALTLTALTLPVVITATEEALRQVPSDLRLASLALGAGKWRTTWRVVLPAALPGVITGIILGLSRAAGETAPILFTAAAFFLPRLPKDPTDKVMALPYHVYVLATQVPNVPHKIVWGTALVLVSLVTIVSVIAAAWRSVVRRRIKW